MKQCDHFKDLILTDYIDGQMEKGVIGQIENHLLDCHDCREFLKEVKMSAIMPMRQASRQEVPAALWDAIKQNIENENQARNPIESIIEKIKETLVFPRLVPVFASLVLMFFVGSLTMNNIQIQKAQEKDQGEYLVSMLSPVSTASTAESSDLGDTHRALFSLNKIQGNVMTKSKKFLTAMIGLFILAGAGTAQAQNPPRQHIERRVQEIFDQLNLTDDQKQQLEANKQQHRARMENARQALKIQKQAIQEELMKTQLDMPKVTAIHNQIKALQDQMEDDKLSSILAVRAILTPDQFSKFVILMHKKK